MRFAENFKDYELIDANGGKRLERWGNITLVRPDPQAMWHLPQDDKKWKSDPGFLSPVF
jgi:23S rRNA (cytosine1962-C5)-methyltransferase